VRRRTDFSCFGTTKKLVPIPIATHGVGFHYAKDTGHTFADAFLDVEAGIEVRLKPVEEELAAGIGRPFAAGDEPPVGELR